MLHFDTNFISSRGGGCKVSPSSSRTIKCSETCWSESSRIFFKSCTTGICHSGLCEACSENVDFKGCKSSSSFCVMPVPGLDESCLPIFVCCALNPRYSWESQADNFGEGFFVVFHGLFFLLFFRSD